MWHATFNNDLLYTLVELQRFQLTPFRLFMHMGKHIHANKLNAFSHTRLGRSVSATYELWERVTRHYPRTTFGITHTFIKNKKVAVVDKVIWKKPFCELRHFVKKDAPPQPRLLIVAPMSGHYATLLRGTVEGLLPYFDVYITDWTNASEVPLADGHFGLQDFIDYTTECIKVVGKNMHIMGVCQPSVPVLAAVSLLSASNSPYVPKTMVLMGGPVDARHSPTEVNSFAAEREIHWFERYMVTRVPSNYRGFMRKVYPGFLQLCGFMAMNMYRHAGEHVKLFYHLVEGDGESATAHKKFYNEYLAVMDLPAEFYLETVTAVFKDFLLPRGKLIVHGERVQPQAITKTALLAIEGERDDISGRGQTKAALDLCKNIPDSKKHYHLQMGVGHYGTFNGQRYRNEIVPVIRDFIMEHK